MAKGREIAFSAFSKLGGEVVAHQQTMDYHRIIHPEPFSDDDVIDCIEAPHLVARTGHDDPDHKDRALYYKNRNWNDGGPNMMKVVVEHGENPGVLTSAFRTDRFTQDGTLLYIDPKYYGGKLR